MNKKSLIALALVAVLGVVGVTIAYFTSTDNFENVFKTKPYSMEVVETFQSPEADELLENIEMKIKLDGKEIYEGKATGLDYTDEGIDLQQAILLGELTPSKVSKM